MLRVYRGLLRLYPAAYRQEFMEEMIWVASQAQNDLDGLPFTVRACFCAREVVGLLSGAVEEHLRNIFGVNNFYRLRSRDMGPEFRFPRSTIWLMLVILVGVMLVIAQAKSIQLKYATGFETTSVWSNLPGFGTVVLALVCIAGSAGWAILFALGRSGMQRLSRLPTGSVPEIKDKN